MGGRAERQDKVLAHVLKGVDVAYQNLESVELGVTTVDTYFDTLGGISRAVRPGARRSDRRRLHRRPDARRRSRADAFRAGFA